MLNSKNRTFRAALCGTSTPPLHRVIARAHRTQALQVVARWPQPEYRHLALRWSRFTPLGELAFWEGALRESGIIGSPRIFEKATLMHGSLLLAALVMSPFLATAAPSYYAYDEAPTDGFMHAMRYQQAKLACGSLPDDLETDYAKAMRLTAEASSEFEKTYTKGLAANPRWRKPATAEEQEAECNQGQVALRVTVRLARQWFPGGW